MGPFQFQTVPNIIAGLGSITQLQTVLQQQRVKKLLLVTDPGMHKQGLHQPIIDILQHMELDYTLYAEVQADPPEAVIRAAASFARTEQVDAVLGFGGGSSMDVAKVIAILAHPEQHQPLEDMYGIDQVHGPRLKLILVPTTAGTGSEVTPISIVTTGKTTKNGIVSPLLFADVTLLDAHLTQDLPRHITAATGIDAMVHAVEAYTSKNKKNFYADLLAVRALQLLYSNLKLVLEDGHDLEARQNMLVGSMLAGQAFANSPVGAVHALAYPLGGHFHISHGHSNALVFTEVLKFNTPHAKQHYAELMQHIEPNSSGSIEGLCDLFIDHMQNYLDMTGLPLTLRALQVPEQALEQLARDAMLQTRLLQNNPRDMSYHDAFNIYQAIYA